MRGLTNMHSSAVKDAQAFLLWANQYGFDVVNAFAGRTGWLHPAMIGYATFGVVLFAGLLLAGWWVARRAGGVSTPLSSSSASTAGSRPARGMAAALWAPVGMLIALGFNQVLVALVHEPRPYTVLPAAEVLVARSADYAFPSDHAVMAGAVAAGLWLVSWRLGYVAAAAAVLMAFARVYVGAHWPGDVLVGLVFGGAVTVLGCVLARTPLTWAVTQLAGTRLRPLLTAQASTPHRAVTGPGGPSDAAPFESRTAPEQSRSEVGRSDAGTSACDSRDTVC